MITRIVKLTFRENRADEFPKLFARVKDKIEAFDGCHGVELLQDTGRSDVYFTYSKWESDDHLQAYRKSELFRSSWSVTKKMFSDKPEAWSLRHV